MSITMTTLDGGTTGVGAEAVDTLRGKLRGGLITPDSAGYDAARRIWNGNIDRRPGAIARCAGVSDVRRAVDFAREQGVRVAVRGGGHSAPGYGSAEGGFVIDLSPMKGVRVDPSNRVAWAEPGVLWLEFDGETQGFGLATTGGTVSNTGVIGLTLGGGLGWLMGKHGATVDNVMGADVVTADGGFVHASATENPDLFWALRGGGGNYGIVTSMQFRLHAVNDVLGGMVLWPLDKARDVLRFYRDFCATLPDEAEAYAALVTAPDGVKMTAVLLGYNGDLAQGEKVLAPMRNFATPAADLITRMPYSARQSMLDDPNAVHGLHRYWRSAFTDTLSDGFIDTMIAGAHRFTSPMSALFMFNVHGALTRVPEDAMAFAARKTQWDFDVIGAWADGAESPQHIAWVREVWDELAPHRSETVYINHMAAEDRPETVRASYGGNHGRLRELKRRYDPGNLFRFNANIAPA